MSDLYRISFRIEQDKVVPDGIFVRLVSRPCRDLHLHGRLRWLSGNLYDVMVEGPRSKVERYFEYLRVGESITGILSFVNRMYITMYGLNPGVLYVDMDKRIQYKRRRRDEDKGHDAGGKRQKRS